MTLKNKKEKRPLTKKRKILYSALGGIFAFLILLNVPLPYYLEMPGSADSLNDIVEVNGKKDTTPGSLNMTTVGVMQTNGATFIAGHLNPFMEVVSKKEMFGGVNSKEYDMMQKYYLETSQNNAQMMALKKANIPYEMTFKGIYVMDVMPGSNFEGKLEPGDLITAVDGQQFQNSQGFIDYIRGKKVGDTLKVTFERGDKKDQTVTGKLKVFEDNKRPSIGIHLIDHTALTVPDYKIEFKLENVGGPSAGMMFTLELYSMLAHQDLKKGRKIAGTGTMEMDGTIGRIGGIDKKVYAANKAGMEIFLAPDDTIEKEVKEKYPELKSNYEEAKAAAKKLKSKMKIVPVKTLDDAIKYLEEN